VCVCVLHPVVTLEISSCSLVLNRLGLGGPRGFEVDEVQQLQFSQDIQVTTLIHQTYHPRSLPWLEEIEETNLQQQTSVQDRRIAS
jgi:hypothetical protein